MNIIATQYSIETNSLDIYIAGCEGPHCKDCHNPESWDFDCGTEFNDDWKFETWDKIQNFNNLIENIFIMGGEPLDQNASYLCDLIHAMQLTKKKVWLFTGKGPMQVPEWVKGWCDYIKCGRYIPELKTEDNVQYGVKLASSNQEIYKKGIDY